MSHCSANCDSIIIIKLKGIFGSLNTLSDFSWFQVRPFSRLLSSFELLLGIVHKFESVLDQLVLKLINIRFFHPANQAWVLASMRFSREILSASLPVNVGVFIHYKSLVA